MFEIIRSFREQVARNRYLKEVGFELVSPPEKLNEKWFDKNGRPSEGLKEVYRRLILVLRTDSTIENRIGNYFELVDIFVVGGQARKGGSDGDLDLYIWVRGTKRSLFMTSDERYLRQVVTAKVNGFGEEVTVEEMINVLGKSKFVDVFISTVKPISVDSGDRKLVLFSRTLNDWVSSV